MVGAIRDFTIDIPQSALDDLADRLARTRFPEAETVDDWSQGIPLAYVEELIGYWRDTYDWRRCEAALNAYPNHKIEIDGVDIHFLHIRSSHDDARPLLLTHGWPGSVVEFLECVGPLTEPEGDGPAFHLVIPSLPGFGFSGKPRAAGWKVEKIAAAWHEMMTALGYERWYAQGGDWGSAVTAAIGTQDLGGCAGVHVNMVFAPPPAEVLDKPDEEEQAALAALAHYQAVENGYAQQQSTKPQTLGYALADSPAGQMAWIVEKFRTWSDVGDGRDAHPENGFARDRLLDNVMIYWLNNAGASSGRLYWESFGKPGSDGKVTVPAGCSIFPQEIFAPSRRWAEGLFADIVYWNRPEKGGHFAAMEQPALFVEEVRAAFAAMPG